MVQNNFKTYKNTPPQHIKANLSAQLKFHEILTIYVNKIMYTITLWFILTSGSVKKDFPIRFYLLNRRTIWSIGILSRQYFCDAWLYLTLLCKLCSANYSVIKALYWWTLKYKWSAWCVLCLTEQRDFFTLFTLLTFTQ